MPSEIIKEDESDYYGRNKKSDVFPLEYQWLEL